MRCIPGGGGGGAGAGAGAVLVVVLEREKQPEQTVAAARMNPRPKNFIMKVPPRSPRLVSGSLYSLALMKATASRTLKPLKWLVVLAVLDMVVVLFFVAPDLIDETSTNDDT